jgi:hypothetical protein
MVKRPTMFIVRGVRETRRPVNRLVPPQSAGFAGKPCG